MIQKNEPLSTKDFDKGLVTRSKIIENNPNQSPNCMDIKWYFDGAIGKRMGASSTNTVTVGSTAAAGWTIDSMGNLSTSLQSYWKMDETVGTRADSVSTNNLIEIGSSVIGISGIRGQAGLFASAASQGLLVATQSSLQTGNIDFTMAAWIYLNSTSTTLQRTIISKKDPETGDVPTVTLLHFDGTNGSTTFTDSSNSNHTYTAIGNAQLDTSQKQFGTASGKFDGVNSTLSTGTSTDFAMGSGDFTVDFFVRFNSVANTQWFQNQDTTNNLDILWRNSNNLAVFLQTVEYDFSWTPVINTWYHVAVTRSGSNLRAFINGTQIGTTQTSNDNITSSATLYIASDNNNSNFLNGWLDEYRITKGLARWTANFTTPATSYGTNNFEYWLFINTNQQATFQVSSTGTNATATVSGSSFGAIAITGWHRIMAWHSNGTHIGIDVDLSTNTANYTTGVRVGSSPFVLGALSSGSTQFFDGRIDEVGFWKRAFNRPNISDIYGGGSGNTYSSGASGFGWGIFDFGATGIRWLTVAAGTGIVASSNLGTTFVTIATSRTQMYQYFDRSKNVLIATSDAQDVPLYWAGSATTFASTLAPGSAPGCKFNINYNGFLLLMNAAGSPRTVYYANENTQLTDAWTNNFTVPSSADDEITAAFILYRYLYISTRYRLFRVAFAGGNPDWLFLKVKDWGYVPRTAKLVTMKGNQVVVGLDWQRRLRVFDGFDDLFVSDNVENNNSYCDFAMSKISYAGSGLLISNAEFDTPEQEYRLNVAIGLNSSQTTHAIVLNGRTLAMYPYSNQPYQAICIAESNNQQHLMAVDRSGFVYILNSGNMDVATSINEVYDSPLLFQQIPSQVQKSQQINFYFKVDSTGTIQYRDRADMSNVYSAYKPLTDKNGNTEITGSENYLQALRVIDLPGTYNTYQFSLGSSGTANPWKLTRWDFLQEPKGIGRGV